jgi:hypothetical protein
MAIKPGRKSSADLSVVTSFPSQRPPAPDHLSESERAEWRALTGCMPSGWFPRESHAALAALCRHTVRSRLLGRQISKIEDKCFGSEDALRFLDKLLAMLERETRCIAALSRGMRLTQQTRVDKGAAGRATSGPAPSFFETMTLEDETNDD